VKVLPKILIATSIKSQLLSFLNWPSSFSEKQVADSEEARTGEAEVWLEAGKEGSNTSSVSGPSDGIYDRFKGAGEEVAAEGTLPQGSSSSNSNSSRGNGDSPTAPGAPLSTPLYKAEEGSINTSSSSRGKPNFAIPPSEAVPSSLAPSSPDGDLRSPGKPYFAPLSTPDPLHLQGPPYQPWKGIDSPVFAAAGPADNSPPFPSPSGSSSGLVQQGQLVILQKKHGVRESMFVMTPVDQVQVCLFYQAQCMEVGCLFVSWERVICSFSLAASRSRLHSPLLSVSMSACFYNTCNA